MTVTDDDGWKYTYIHLNNDSPGTDDGRNLYELAFADGMREGQRVKAGELVGYAGDSGNAEAAGSHLHFEMHDPAGTVINPFENLNLADRDFLSARAMAAAAPRGNVDVVASASSGTVRVAGWAVDRTTDAPVDVSIYVGGAPTKTVSASLSRPDIASAVLGGSIEHGFDTTVSGLTSGIHGVCAVFHNVGDGGGNLRTGCTVVNIP